MSILENQNAQCPAMSARELHLCTLCVNIIGQTTSKASVHMWSCYLSVLDGAFLQEHVCALWPPLPQRAFSLHQQNIIEFVFKKILPFRVETTGFAEQVCFRVPLFLLFLVQRKTSAQTLGNESSRQVCIMCCQGLYYLDPVFLVPQSAESENTCCGS